MYIWIVECVPGDDAGFVVGTTGSKSGSIIVYPRDISSKLILFADETDVVEVRHSEVLACVEACHEGVYFEAVGCTYPVEAVNNHDRAFFLRAATKRHRFGRETFSSRIYGCDFEAINRIGYYTFRV